MSDNDMFSIDFIATTYVRTIQDQVFAKNRDSKNTYDQDYANAIQNQAATGTFVAPAKSAELIDVDAVKLRDTFIQWSNGLVSNPGATFDFEAAFSKHIYYKPPPPPPVVNHPTPSKAVGPSIGGGFFARMPGDTTLLHGVVTQDGHTYVLVGGITPFGVSEEFLEIA